MVGVGKQPRSGRWHLASKGGYIHSSLVSLFLSLFYLAPAGILQMDQSVHFIAYCVTRVQSRVRIVT